ncbi:MAG TPA: hypothetical protein VFA47_09975 [Candidatus Manganitrophaceae bacterium]|nr:hypothetical protein [Candidatus Manganitrophaceae bacterium]
MGTALKEVYCHYSGEGGLRVSADLVRAQLTYLRERLPPMAQRRLLLAGVRAVLTSPPNGKIEIVAQSLLHDLDRLCSGDISAVQIEHFLERLSTLEKSADGGLGPRAGRKLSCDEGNGAYYSPELFQHLLRLLQMPVVFGSEINVLEPNVGKGALIRPIASHSGFLTLGVDLNPLSAEITEVTNWVDPAAVTQACRNGEPLPLSRRCGVLSGHVFDLFDRLPNGLFDLLLANPPYINDMPKKGLEKTFRGLGLSKLADGFSLTSFTRQVLPMKLRDGGFTFLVSSARSRGFKRVRHATGHISHPILILALSGQPFAANGAELAPISMSAYRFDGEKLAGKEQVEAQCFITLSAYLPAREANGKQTAWSECDILAMDYGLIPRFVELCLSPARWGPLEKQHLGTSMRMARLANLLRLFVQMKEAIHSRIDKRLQGAKRSFQIQEAERFRKMRDETGSKRFQQIGTISDIQSWVRELESKWDIPLQEEILLHLKRNPLRDLFSKGKRASKGSSVVSIGIRRAFDAILAVSNRFYPRFYILSAIFLSTAGREIRDVYGPFNGFCFECHHPVLKTVPYPFSLYLLNGRELTSLIEAFPEAEQKAVISHIGERSRIVRRSAVQFNRFSEEAATEMAAAIGDNWKDSLYAGEVPAAGMALPLTRSQNQLARELGRLLLYQAQQNPARVNAVNHALSPLESAALQERYYAYLKQFSSSTISTRRINNLIEKTDALISNMEQVERILTGRSNSPRVKPATLEAVL